MAGSNKTIRVASVQWQAGNIAHPDAFHDRIDYFVHAAADYNAAVSREEQVAADFNAAIRAYKAANPN